MKLNLNDLHKITYRNALQGKTGWTYGPITREKLAFVEDGFEINNLNKSYKISHRNF